MKKHCYSSLSHFYDNIKNVSNSPKFEFYDKLDNPKWMGLSLDNIHKFKFSYPMGVEKLSHFKDVEVQKDLNVKFYNQFDGYDIDIDRMLENLDFLVDTRKKRQTPKAVDIYIQIGEPYNIGYAQMLCKTYAAIKIIDKLESNCVRCAVYACNAFSTICHNQRNQQDGYLEVCIKNHAETINLGALCTAISPWAFRHFFLLHLIGHFPDINLQKGASLTESMPSDIDGIIIRAGQCHEIDSANQFIESIKI